MLNYHARIKGKAVAELDQWERLPILISNVFGVDLDMQAVEITRLNLLLRSLAKREILPGLADNVRQGNSLISGGSEEELKTYFGDNWQEKKPFSWELEFKNTVAQGGFDVVVGNPPYVRIQTLPRDEADYYREHFESAFGSFDIYVLFLEKGIRLLKPGGRLGFICSGKFLKSQYGQKIQQLMAKECTVENIVDLSAQTVFAEATTYPAIVVVRKGKDESPLRYMFMPQELANSVTAAISIDALPIIQTSQDAITKGVWPPSATGDRLWAKLSANTVPLSQIAERIFQGLITSADKVYILQKRGETKGGLILVYSRITGKGHELEAELLKPLLSGQDIKRYSTPAPTNLLLFPYHVGGDKAELIPAQEFANAYPRCWRYLLDNREILEGRERGKMRHERWYAYVYPKNLALHDRRKLAIPRLVKHLEAVYDGEASFYLDNVDVGGLILKDASEQNYLFVLGLLHSRLLDFCFHRISAPFRGGFRSANRQFIEPLAIRSVNMANPAEKQIHNNLVSLVTKMLELNRKLKEFSEFEVEKRQALEREIQHTYEAIDALVYDLYGLTDVEIKEIESETS